MANQTNLQTLSTELNNLKDELESLQAKQNRLLKEENLNQYKQDLLKITNQEINLVRQEIISLTNIVNSIKYEPARIKNELSTLNNQLLSAHKVVVENQNNAELFDNQFKLLLKVTPIREQFDYYNFTAIFNKDFKPSNIFPQDRYDALEKEYQSIHSMLINIEQIINSATKPPQIHYDLHKKINNIKSMLKILDAKMKLHTQVPLRPVEPEDSIDNILEYAKEIQELVDQLNVSFIANEYPPITSDKTIITGCTKHLKQHLESLNKMIENRSRMQGITQTFPGQERAPVITGVHLGREDMDLVKKLNNETLIPKDSNVKNSNSVEFSDEVIIHMKKKVGEMIESKQLAIRSSIKIIKGKQFSPAEININQRTFLYGLIVDGFHTVISTVVKHPLIHIALNVGKSVVMSLSTLKTKKTPPTLDAFEADLVSACIDFERNGNILDMLKSFPVNEELSKQEDIDDYYKKLIDKLEINKGIIRKTVLEGWIKSTPDSPDQNYPSDFQFKGGFIDINIFLDCFIDHDNPNSIMNIQWSEPHIYLNDVKSGLGILEALSSMGLANEEIGGGDLKLPISILNLETCVSINLGKRTKKHLQQPDAYKIQNTQGPNYYDTLEQQLGVKDTFHFIRKNKKWSTSPLSNKKLEILLEDFKTKIFDQLTIGHISVV